MIGKVLSCLNSISKMRDVSKSADFIEETTMALLLLNFPQNVWSLFLFLACMPFEIKFHDKCITCGAM